MENVGFEPSTVPGTVHGTVYETRTPADVGGNTWAVNKPFFLILNLAVGGYWPGDRTAPRPSPPSWWWTRCR